MAEHTDDRLEETKGRVKQAAGDLTGNKDLQREGKLDQKSAKAKRAVDKAGDKIEEGIDKAKEHLQH